MFLPCAMKQQDKLLSKSIIRIWWGNLADTAAALVRCTLPCRVMHSSPPLALQSLSHLYWRHHQRLLLELQHMDLFLVTALAGLLET